MTQKTSQYINEITSIFMLLMMIWAFTDGHFRPQGEANAAAFSYSVTKASKVATEPLRRPAKGGRRLFD